MSLSPRFAPAIEVDELTSEKSQEIRRGQVSREETVVVNDSFMVRVELGPNA